jgi:hypothetical protein
MQKLLAVCTVCLLSVINIYAQRQISKIDFENNSDYPVTDWNIGNYCGFCTNVSGGMIKTDDPVNPSNKVSKITLKSCEPCDSKFHKSDNRGEGFVLMYNNRTEISLEKVYTYKFSYYVPAGFNDWQHDEGGNWVIVSQWVCWCDGANCFGKKTCPTANPDRYCDTGGAGSSLTFDNRDYTYRMKFKVDEGEGDDCITLTAKSTATPAAGSWDKHVMEIRWVDNNTGYIRWWMNEKLVAEQFYFRTWWNDAALPAWKVGMYMGSWDDGNWDAPDDDITMYVDNLELYENTASCIICPNCEKCTPGNSKLPEAPTNITTPSVTPSKIKIEWKDQSLSEDGFVIQRKAPGESFTDVFRSSKDVTGYTDSGLTPNTGYTYRVGAFNFIGTNWSDEIQIKTLPDDGSIKIPAQISGASGYLGIYKPERALDTQLNTYWMSEGTGQWLEIDLGILVEITKIRAAFVNGNQRIYDFTIEASTDKMNWQNIGLFQTDGVSTGLAEYEVVKKNARYIRFVTLKNNIDQRTWLSELEVWGIVTTSAYKLLNNSGEILIYPVPAFGKFYIQINGYESNVYTFKMHDIFGKLCLSHKFSGNSLFIPITNTKSGIYLVSVTAENKTVFSRIIPVE